jgi:hypothetical protein
VHLVGFIIKKRLEMSLTEEGISARRPAGLKTMGERLRVV